jgi:hypothetical protein
MANGVIGRGSLPANYEDFKGSVTANLLLPTPQPQYLFAQFAMAGRLSLAAMNAGAMSVQQYVSMAGAGAPISADLDRLIRTADMYPGFFQTIDQFGKGLGDTVKFQRPVFSNGGLTKASRKLNTNQTISTTGRTIQTEEVPIILEEFHGPFGSGDTTPQPFAIWGFDAKYRANKMSLVSLATLNLTQDYTVWLDTVMRDELRAGSTITLSDPSYTDVTGYTVGGGSGFSLEQIMRARKALTDREWRPFPNGRYVLLVPTEFNTQMLTDVEYRELSKVHGDGRNQIFGYIGSVQDVDIFECSTLKSYVATDTVPGTGGGTVGTSVVLEEAIMVGPGAVGFGTVAPDPENEMGPVARFADDTNYGTVAKVIWYALHAIGGLDLRGTERLIAQSA